MLDKETLEKFKKCYVDGELAEKLIKAYKAVCNDLGEYKQCDGDDYNEDNHEEGYCSAFEFVILETIKHCEIK